MVYHYLAFGLNIHSEIECPYLLSGSDSHPDLVIRYGEVPQQLSQDRESGINYQISEGQFILVIERVARYLISGGCEILVQPYPDVDPKDLRLFLLGSAMGALLHQRGIWPLHGSCVGFERKAAIFLGASGSGKSTLAGALHQRGYQSLSDDVCAVTTHPEGFVQVWPAYPRISLWPDSVIKLGSHPEQLQQTHTSQDKYDYPVQRFSRDPVLVTAVYILTSVDRGDLCLMPVKGFDKVRELTANTYRLHFLTGMGLDQQHFHQAQALARQASMMRITYPRGSFLLEELVNLIEKDMI